MSSTWIFDPRYGYYEVRFEGTAQVLRRYCAGTTKLLRGSFYSNLAVYIVRTCRSIEVFLYLISSPFQVNDNINICQINETNIARLLGMELCTNMNRVAFL